MEISPYIYCSWPDYSYSLIKPLSFQQWGMKALYNTVTMNLNLLSINTHEAVTMELVFASVFYQHKHINNIKLNQTYMQIS
jgi:hypothetical protein